MPRADTFNPDLSTRQCQECGTIVGHHYDLRRHMLIHGIGKNPLKHKCLWENCDFETLQKSNLNTHHRMHLKDKSKVCPECSFKTTDPASLIRHRKRIHGYVPKPRRARTFKIEASNSVVSTASAATSSSSRLSSQNLESILDFDSSAPGPNVEPSLDSSTNKSDEAGPSNVSEFDRWLPSPQPLLHVLASTPPLSEEDAASPVDSPFNYPIQFEGSSTSPPFSCTGNVEVQDFHTISRLWENNIIGYPSPYDNAQGFHTASKLWENNIIGAYDVGSSVESLRGVNLWKRCWP
ncbi:hypothetical protein BDP27DRAFT_1402464 [Rhodocollybia butyracea]|uniref:C2H2-type domain-containing protein n=1 Tax=Rhodocollybia butyracea TaxID=206335 RepID=A0A9P5PUX4_9AGAR|nr:hypothetical protein BDP27DRAFT_1402464 [Rhodocollybia butyracea]